MYRKAEGESNGFRASQRIKGVWTVTRVHCPVRL